MDLPVLGDGFIAAGRRSYQYKEGSCEQQARHVFCDVRATAFCYAQATARKKPPDGGFFF